MSEDAPIHAGCVASGGRGILIFGPSGAGKSDLAIRLIDRGAELVSDDYTSLRADGGQLLASPPDAIAGRIEVRGVGIVARPFLANVPVCLVVDLAVAPERLPQPAQREWLGLTIPAIGLAALEPSAPIKVEAALTSYGLALPCRP